MIYKIRRFSTTADMPVNPSEVTKFKVNLNRLTNQLGPTEDITK